MEAQDDFEELLKLFSKHKVKYCIIGAIAFAFHARPRYTKDIDILVEPSRDNAVNILHALKEFGFGSLNLSERDFTRKDQIIQLGHEPGRIDLITSITGLSFEKVWRGKEKGYYRQTKVYYIGRKELIRAKELAHRPQDIVDLDLLRNTSRKKGKKKHG